MTPDGEVCRMLVEWSPPPFMSCARLPELITLVLRMRGSVTGLSLVGANTTVETGPTNSVEVVAVDAAAESVSVSVMLRRGSNCSGSVVFTAEAAFVIG